MPDTIEETPAPQQKIYYDQRSVALRTSQSISFVQEHDKMQMLDLVLRELKETQVLLVVKSKKKADAIRDFLLKKGLRADSVHGNHRQEKQREVASVFNSSLLNIVITTDMICKTLELEGIKFLINYDLPSIPQDYYNRLAYMKEEGESLSFINPEDDGLLASIELNMKREIEEKIVEGFVGTDTTQNKSQKRDKRKKPRHRKMKDKTRKDEIL